ncbi:hypothetical protein LTR62_002671 [Meristemomyces frigidus]|uniref:Amino acid transporter n=1 Tax=Meristemomyces frigidus TaxID=1508187 RepID=A0AAN7YS13_9PEZI|nr:hypothetical protein LTR62_002671 [Meristemomyces frigidus]
MVTGSEEITTALPALSLVCKQFYHEFTSVLREVSPGIATKVTILNENFDISTLEQRLRNIPAPILRPARQTILAIEISKDVQIATVRAFIEKLSQLLALSNLASQMHWTSTIAWQAGYAQGILLAGTQIQTIILVMNEDYSYPAWQGTLLSFAAILISYAVNVYGVRSLAYWQVPVFAIGTMAYFAYIISVWVNAPRATHTEVWTGFSNTGGWSSMTRAAEEVKDAAVAVPRAMITIFLVDCALVFPLIVTICYYLPDVEAALNDTTSYPGIYIMRQAMSTIWIAVILAVITFMVMASNITYLAGVSRDLFAFARDNGLPFSAWFSKVDQKRSIPINANVFSCVLSGILALIYIVSPVAFYAITSLNTVSLLQCYVFAIGCVLWRRIVKPETLPPARFSLGAWGTPINIAAVAYSVWSFFWCFWPQATPVDAGGFNWAGPLCILALIVAGLYYIRARHRYEGPVVAVEGRNVHAR